MLAADVACGLSLGEYTALTFAGAIRCASRSRRFVWHRTPSAADSEHCVVRDQCCSSAVLCFQLLGSRTVRLNRMSVIDPFFRMQMHAHACMHAWMAGCCQPACMIGRGARYSVAELQPVHGQRAMLAHKLPASMSHNTRASRQLFAGVSDLAHGRATRAALRTA